MLLFVLQDILIATFRDGKMPTTSWTKRRDNSREPADVDVEDKQGEWIGFTLVNYSCRWLDCSFEKWENHFTFGCMAELVSIPLLYVKVSSKKILSRITEIISMLTCKQGVLFFSAITSVK